MLSYAMLAILFKKVCRQKKRIKIDKNEKEENFVQLVSQLAVFPTLFPTSEAVFLLPVWKSNTIHLSFALPLAWYYVVQDSVPIPAIPAIDMVLLWQLLLSCPVLGFICANVITGHYFRHSCWCCCCCSPIMPCFTFVAGSVTSCWTVVFRRRIVNCIYTLPLLLYLAITLVANGYIEQNIWQKKKKEPRHQHQQVEQQTS